MCCWLYNGRLVLLSVQRKKEATGSPFLSTGSIVISHSYGSLRVRMTSLQPSWNNTLDRRTVQRTSAFHSHIVMVHNGRCDNRTYIYWRHIDWNLCFNQDVIILMCIKIFSFYFQAFIILYFCFNWYITFITFTWKVAYIYKSLVSLVIKMYSNCQNHPWWPDEYR